jgi:hypothetical protein
MFAFLTEVTAAIVGERTGKYLGQGTRGAKKWIRRHWPGTALQAERLRVTNVVASLHRAIDTLEHVTDQVLHLDPGGDVFDPRKVHVAANTKMLFKLGTPTVTRILASTNTLHIGFGRRDGVIEGVVVRINHNGRAQTYILTDRDLHYEHICIQPTGLSLAGVSPSDMIVSFESNIVLNDLETRLAALLDATMSAAAECRRVIAQH